MIALSPAVLADELRSARDYLSTWLKEIETQGIPGEDTIGGEEAADAFFRKLSGDLRIVAGKCDILSDVVNSTVRG